MWTVDLAQDVTECHYFESGKGLMKSKGYIVNLNKQMVCGDERDPIVLTGFVFKFNKKEMTQFGEIMCK